MIKIIWSILSSLLLVFIIWCVVIYTKYGTLDNYHIDFYASFSKINVSSDWAKALSGFVQSGENLQLNLSKADIYFADWAKNALSNTNMSWLTAIVDFLSIIFKGIYYIYSFVYFLVDLVKSVAVWFTYACWILIQLIGFLFNPSVVPITRGV